MSSGVQEAWFDEADLQPAVATHFWCEVCKTVKVVLQTTRGWRTDDNLDKGAFHFKRLQPGRYKVVARAGEQTGCVT